MHQGEKLLEVIVCSLEDALEAERGGADRMEVVRDLDRGGFTPSLDLVRKIKSRVQVPMRVMLRESEDEDRPPRPVLEKLSSTLSELEEIGIDGVVLGYLSDGQVDTETMIEILSTARKISATFHHAFDNSRVPVQTIRALHKLPQVDHVLTSGGLGTLSARGARLNQYCDTAGATLTILAGGGMTPEVLRDLTATTNVREFHVGRAARDPNSGNVSASLVSQLKNTLRRSGLAEL